MPRSLDDELEANQAEEEERRRQEFEAQQQQDRLGQQQQNNPVNQLKNVAEDQAKKYAKKVVKKAVWEAILATSPYWGTALLILAGITLILFVVIAVPIAVCKSSYFDGVGTATGKAIFTASGFCSAFEGGRSGGGGAAGDFGKIDIVLTSAYRPGAIVAGTNRPSAHGRGEAVDIALRPLPADNNDPRIDQLIALINSFGFLGPPIVSGAAADTLDEYRKPTEGASGGHIHIEFNTYVTNGVTNTHCDNTIAKFPPPSNELIDIPSTIPTAGSSIWKLRQCMLDKVQAIFNAASTP